MEYVPETVYCVMKRFGSPPSGVSGNSGICMRLCFRVLHVLMLVHASNTTGVPIYSRVWWFQTSPFWPMKDECPLVGVMFYGEI